MMDIIKEWLIIFGPFPGDEIRSILTDKGFVWRKFPGYSPSCREALEVGIWGDWSHGICVLEAEPDRCYQSVPFILYFSLYAARGMVMAMLECIFFPQFIYCWHALLIPALERQRQVDLWVQDQPDLQSELQDSQGYTEKPCLEKKKPERKK